MKTLESLCDQCVKCGLCLQHCPTYRLLQQEADSPRGRIALIEALHSGALEPTPELIGHLERCLLCRACEAYCPAKVEYSLIMDMARETLFSTPSNPNRPPWKVRMLTLSLSASPWFLKLSGHLVSLYQRSGLQWLVRKTRVSALFGLADYEAILPPPSDKSTLTVSKCASTTPSTPVIKRPIAIFNGCMGEMLDRDTVQAAKRLLRALGYEPAIIKTQQCCGALALHHGDAERARRLARENIRAFSATDAPIVFLATGCGILLKEYAQLFNTTTDSEEAQSFADRCVEICDFIAQHPQFEQLKFHSLPARIAVHTPCSLRNVLKCEASVTHLLARIPEAAQIPLPSNDLCCGAAGSYMLTQPTLSQSLLSYKIDDLQHIAPDILVSSNIGCLLHMQAGMIKAGTPIKCLHPIALLANQLCLPHTKNSSRENDRS